MQYAPSLLAITCVHSLLWFFDVKLAFSHNSAILHGSPYGSKPHQLFQVLGVEHGCAASSTSMALSSILF